MAYQFMTPHKTFFGQHALALAQDSIRSLGKRALIVTGKVVTKTGLVNRLTEYLDKWNVEYVIFNDIPGEPTDVVVEEGVKIYKNFYSEDAIKAQARVILDIANRRESCILFGRCADYILREHPNVINFFLYAPMDYRVQHIANGYEIGERESVKLIKRIDRQRHNYYKYVTGRNRGDRNGKQMFIDVETFGVEGSVKMMRTAIEYLY